MSFHLPPTLAWISHPFQRNTLSGSTLSESLENRNFFTAGFTLSTFFLVLVFKPLLSNLIEHVLQYLFRCCWWYVSMLTISQWLTFLLKCHTNSIWSLSEFSERKLKVKNYKLCWGGWKTGPNLILIWLSEKSYQLRVVWKMGLAGVIFQSRW